MIGYCNAQRPITIQSISFDGEYDKHDLYEIVLFQNEDTVQMIEDPDFDKLIAEDGIEYELEYYDILLQKNTFRFKSDTITSDTILICPDCIIHNDSNKGSWALKASKKKPLFLKIDSYGCFHISHDSLVFFKSKGNYYVNYNDTLRTINQTDFIHIINFEKELRLVEGGRCTTTDHYTLQFKSNTYKKVDGGCTWDGFLNLMDKLKIPLRKYKSSGWW